EASRRHRWIRGDWQLAGWLLLRVPGPSGPNGAQGQRQTNPLSALSVWKLFDNLRRSLVPPSLLAVLAVGWLLGPAWFWSLLVVTVVCVPTLLASGIELIHKPRERAWLLHLNLTGRSVGRPLLLALLTLILLPYDALISLDAILRSGVRMLFTRRGLLLWQLPSYARRNARRTLADFAVEMWIAPLLAVLLATSLIWLRPPEEWLFAAPVLLLWMGSPLVGWWISRPLVAPTPDLTAAQRTFLRASARRTWRYFADFVGPEDNWLPPDNVQEYPAPAIARRTSPTNIGMALLANLTACDFGFISTGECLHLTEKTLATMERLERYRGHFYNWYDTLTLEPLRPRYISSVDSGNLVGSLLTLQAGLAELKDQPVLSSQAFTGLQDTLEVLAEHLPAVPVPELAEKIRALQNRLSTGILNGPPQTLVAAERLLDEIHRLGEDLLAWLPADMNIDGELYSWAQAFNRQSLALCDELRLLLPESQQLGAIPKLSELASGDPAGKGARSMYAAKRLKTIDDLVQRCGELASMEFDFLYNTSRGLFCIGYDVGERRRDPACYDLLASEARLASFLLISQGQIPQKHWFSLGRLLTSHGGDVSLISWSGSMFEYLMPQLIMPSYPNTLLEQACKAAVSRQIEYGRQRAVPWGISESCYNLTDMHQVYQYRAFGVPGLGFKRG
ncbi:MAG: cyclic beta 1-2 glucan synthetase, partial [Thiobacillus sp.]